MTTGEPRAVMWHTNPIWTRLHAQPSWSAFLRTMSLEQGVSLDVVWSSVGRNYHCQAFRLDRTKSGYQREFLAEGFGSHPLGAVRAALARFQEPLAPRVRSTLLEALLDYLRVEIDRHGLLDRFRGEG